jgi:hypothetical protein
VSFWVRRVSTCRGLRACRFRPRLAAWSRGNAGIDAVVLGHVVLHRQGRRARVAAVVLAVRHVGRNALEMLRPLMLYLGAEHGPNGDPVVLAGETVLGSRHFVRA